ncbi:hypothetical protein OAD79_05375 [Flavobacteriales bacterium]|jgi:hypothetical protein|nr:hypothetical protein [Flavobacteriales bacterium]
MKKFNEIKKLIIVLIICVTSSFMIAQNDINPKKENIEALKIAFFTSKMNLNVEESKIFWPIVNEMENELKSLKNKNAHGRMMLIDKKTEELSDRELEEMMDARIQMGKKQIDIKIKYHEKFKEVLSIQKVAKYYQTTKEFKKIQSERKKQHNNPGERPGNRN